MNEGVWKSFGLASTSSVTGLRQFGFGKFSLRGREIGKKNFCPSPDFDKLSHRGGKLFIVSCYLSFEITTEGALWIWCCLFYRNWLFTARNKLAKWSKQILRLRSGCWALGILGLETVFVKLNEIMVTDKNKILNSHFEEENIRFLVEFGLCFI